MKQTSLCLRSSILGEAQCGVRLKNKCEVSEESKYVFFNDPNPDHYFFILWLLIVLSDEGGKFVLTSSIYLKTFGLLPVSLWEVVFPVVLAGNMFTFAFYVH